MNLIRTHIAGLCMLALNHHYLVHISKQLRHIQCLLDESRTWINYFLKRQFLKKLLMIQDILIIRYLIFFVFLCSFSYLRVRIKCVRSFGVIWFLPDCQLSLKQFFVLYLFINIVRKGTFRHVRNAETHSACVFMHTDQSSLSAYTVNDCWGS